MGKSKKKSKKSDKKKHHKVHKSKDKSKKIKDLKKKILKDEKTPVVDDDTDFAVPLGLMDNKSHAPETQEEYIKRSSKIRKEVDPISGRTRLIKGDSEVLEEIVTKQRHKEINKSATQSDGQYFQDSTIGRKKV